MLTKIMTGLLLATLILVAGCSDPSSPSTARVSVSLTDAPLDLSTVKAVNVTLDCLILFPRGSGDNDGDGMRMGRPGQEACQEVTLNLLDFQNGKTITIADLDVTPGEYHKLRMYVMQAELVSEDPDDPTLEITDTISIPSGKVDIPVPFVVSGGENMEVVVDFDAALSVQVNSTPGNKEYILRPVITPVGTSVR